MLVTLVTLVPIVTPGYREAGEVVNKGFGFQTLITRVTPTRNVKATVEYKSIKRALFWKHAEH